MSVCVCGWVSLSLSLCCVSVHLCVGPARTDNLYTLLDEMRETGTTFSKVSILVTCVQSTHGHRLFRISEFMPHRNRRRNANRHILRKQNLYLVTFCGKYARALTFQNFCHKKKSPKRMPRTRTGKMRPFEKFVAPTSSAASLCVCVCVWVGGWVGGWYLPNHG